jgi:uncharacterized protein (TIGR02001 family)
MLCKANMRRRPLALMLAALAAMCAASLPAAAEDEAPTSNYEFSANVGIASDYAFRGFTQTREHPAVFGGVDLTFSWFYVGFWASNVDFGKVQDGSGRFHDVADAEIDIYAGIKRQLGPVELDVGVIYYAYPSAFGFLEAPATDASDLDYVEVKAGISGTLHQSLTGSFTIYYSPDYFGEVGENWVFEGTLTRELASFSGITPSLSGTLGYSEGDESDGGFDYWYWNIGVAFAFLEDFEFDLRYYDSFDVPASFGSCTDVCDGRVIARLTYEY